MELAPIIELAQLGAIPMLTVAVAVLWRRSNALTDRFLTYLEDRAAKGDDDAVRALIKPNK